jgi:hypothetical protein
MDVIKLLKIKLLKEDHQKVKKMLDELEDTSERTATRPRENLQPPTAA